MYLIEQYTGLTFAILRGPSTLGGSPVPPPVAITLENPLRNPYRTPCARRPGGFAEVKLATHRPAIRWLRTLAYVAALACTSIAQADVFTDGDQVMLQIGPYVYHTSEETYHNSAPKLIGVEWESASRWEIGASYFENTFYQPCIYIYGGKRWFLRSADQGLYIKLTGGPLYGYKDEYEDKVPLNSNGLGLAIIPAVGYQYKRANAQLVILGTAAIMLTFGYDVWK